MNLDKCLHACRAAGLSKDRRKTLKDRETLVHFEKDNNKWRETATTTTSGGNRKGQAGSGDRLFDSKKRMHVLWATTRPGPRKMPRVLQEMQCLSENESLQGPVPNQTEGERLRPRSH